MDDARARLTRCFCAVFPRLRGQEFDSATVETVAGWDSTATVTLVALLEEEFGIQFESSAFERLLSFRSLLDYLEGRSVSRQSEAAAEKRP